MIEPRWPRNVKQLRSGQKFTWCDRVVTLVRTGEVHRGNKRPSRQLIVDVPDIGIRKLWYFDDEKVQMVHLAATTEAETAL